VVISLMIDSFFHENLIDFFLDFPTIWLSGAKWEFPIVIIEKFRKTNDSGSI
jgi:hypothetical protein